MAATLEGKMEVGLKSGCVVGCSLPVGSKDCPANRLDILDGAAACDAADVKAGAPANAALVVGI